MLNPFFFFKFPIAPERWAVCLVHWNGYWLNSVCFHCRGSCAACHSNSSIPAIVLQMRRWKEEGGTLSLYRVLTSKECVLEKTSGPLMSKAIPKSTNFSPKPWKQLFLAVTLTWIGLLERSTQSKFPLHNVFRKLCYTFLKPVTEQWKWNFKREKEEKDKRGRGGERGVAAPTPPYISARESENPMRT